MLQSPIYHSLAPVYLSDHDMNGCLFRYLILKFKQYLQSILMAVQGYKHVSFLEFIEGVLFVNLFSLFKPGQSFLWLAAIVADHAHVGVKDRGPLIDGNCTLEELRCLIEFLLLEADVSETPPCVVLTLISLQSPLITFLGGIKILICYIFVAAQCMRVCKVDI